MLDTVGTWCDKWRLGMNDTKTTIAVQRCNFNIEPWVTKQHEMLGYCIQRDETPPGFMQDIWSQDIQQCIERNERILQTENNISKRNTELAQLITKQAGMDNWIYHILSLRQG